MGCSPVTRPGTNRQSGLCNDQKCRMDLSGGIYKPLLNERRKRSRHFSIDTLEALVINLVAKWLNTGQDNSGRGYPMTPPCPPNFLGCSVVVPWRSIWNDTISDVLTYLHCIWKNSRTVHLAPWCQFVVDCRFFFSWQLVTILKASWILWDPFSAMGR